MISHETERTSKKSRPYHDVCKVIHVPGVTRVAPEFNLGIWLAAMAQHGSRYQEKVCME